MNELITERSGAILRVQLNRPAKKNAITNAMYAGLADLLNAAANDDRIRVVLLHGAGDSFTAGNDLEDFAKNPPASGESPQAKLCDALLNFDKPLIAAVHGFAIGSGTTMLTYCDFVYAGEGTKFQVPFINLALVPEFGSSYAFPARFGHLRAAELVMLGMPFDAARAAALGLVTQVMPEAKLLATATETAQKLAEKPAGAMRACKRLLLRAAHDPTAEAVRIENQEFSARLHSPDTREAIAAFFQKRTPDFTLAHRGKPGVAAS